MREMTADKLPKIDKETARAMAEDAYSLAYDLDLIAGRRQPIDPEDLDEALEEIDFLTRQLREAVIDSKGGSA